MRGIEQKKKEGGEYPYLNVQAFPVGAGRKCEKLTPPDGSVYGTVWDRISLSPASEGFLTRFCIAMGMKVNRKGELVGTLETEEGKPGSVINKRALLRVKSGTNNEGDYRAEVGGWYPYEAIKEDDDLGEEEEDLGAEDEPDDDAFGEDEPEEEESAEEEPEDYYTAESLDALDNDGLKAAASEFDLEAKDFVVKVRGKTNVPKTREAIITAILDAQGVEEGGDEEPF